MTDIGLRLKNDLDLYCKQEMLQYVTNAPEGPL